VTFLRLEYLGPRKVYLAANVDLVGDAAESQVAEALQAVRQRVQADPHVVLAVLGLSTREDPSLTQ
jgi:hypothetical protein